jgi:hypothetical protein
MRKNLPFFTFFDFQNHVSFNQNEYTHYFKRYKGKLDLVGVLKR